MWESGAPLLTGNLGILRVNFLTRIIIVSISSNNVLVQGKQTERSFHGLVRRADDRHPWPQFTTRPSYKLISQNWTWHARHGATWRRAIQRRRRWRHRDVTDAVGGRDGRRMTSNWRRLMLWLQQQRTKFNGQRETQPRATERHLPYGITQC